ncbi:MAG: hypothetical protein M0P39_01950 [Rhodocyclaceae bacterium]|jgi:hypothetical protein|nr:hypothetical protein [Rhodocyclaceae bacterium]
MNDTAHAWRFFRAGGFDQVRIDSADDLLALKHLDQKLWVALACPTGGIEFDPRTLALIDADGDGRIRAPELLAAIDWAAARLSQPQALGAGLSGVPLDAIRDDDDAGRLLAAAARTLADERGKGAAEVISVEEAGAAEEHCRARLHAAWEAAGLQAQAAGSATEAAHAALEAVRSKIDDFFARCRLAAFDSRAAEPLNADIEALRALAATPLHQQAEAIAALPLAQIGADRTLPLAAGANPAWAERLAAFAENTVKPLLGERDRLSESDWRTLLEKLAPYTAWLAARPSETDVPPELVAARDLERLARYVRDLLPLANNFVAFRNFYTRQGKATFQIGTLYLDGRSAELCVAVGDAAKHAALASLARMCLVYCDCVRDGARMSIAAAFTAGDSDQLMAGRNGVFYDRQGRDWDATITRIVDHPISLRQAFWSPYKRLGRLIGEQVQKLAANRAKSVEDRMAVAAVEGVKKTEASAKPVPPPAFDVGKFAGIFAAIGLAVGALGTALASVLTGMLALKWWQMPLAITGLMLAVSGPAMAMAWFKLRSRNLGPLLDANGWAVNARARINIPFGTSLTALAELPPGAERALTDPYADKKAPWGLYLFVVALLAGGAFALWKFTQ